MASRYHRNVSSVPEESSAEETGAEEPVATKRPTLNAAVIRRRADQAFFLRLRDTIVQNHRALERLGR
jgi:hypothetical protein